MRTTIQQRVLFFLLVAPLLVTADTFPECDEGDSTLEQTCNVFGGDNPLSWAPIDFQKPKARWANFQCSNGDLAGIRCFQGSGFTARRYNRWECITPEGSCTIPSSMDTVDSE